MRTSYAVKWREPGGRLYLGRLVLGSDAMLLEGRGGDGSGVTRSIPYNELSGMRLGSAPAERLDKRPALVVERARGVLLVAGAVAHAGILQELIHHLAEAADASERFPQERRGEPAPRV